MVTIRRIQFLAFFLVSISLTHGRLSPCFADDLAKPPAPEMRTLDSHFPFAVPVSLEQWKARAQVVRLQTKVALAIHPDVELSSSPPTIHDRKAMDGYSVEKVYFESLPGLFVTGSLYRPSEETGAKHPAVIYAHGHWTNGRFYEASDNEVRTLLATGAERFEPAAINMFQAACVQLARMGCVVFQFDMLGYADCQQISFERSHLFDFQTPQPPVTDDGWPLYSARAEGYGQSVMALQTVNTIRAIDVISALDDVDPTKLAITGASGGGTQSFIAAAIDSRLAGAFPAVMVSTAMQGGCTCENACGLRVGTGNVEIAATIAPRPLGMTAANDWTRDMPQDGFPELKAIFGLYGKPKNVELNASLHFPHNYNHVSRTALYGWVNRLFNLGLAEPILERSFDRLGPDEMTVWDASHPKPAGGIDFERNLLADWATLLKQRIRSDATESLRQGWTVIASPANEIAKTITLASSPSDNQQLVATVEGGKTVAAMTRTDSKTPADDIAIRIIQTDQTFSVTRLDDLFDATENGQFAVNAKRPFAGYTYGYNAPQLVRQLGVMLAMFDHLATNETSTFTLASNAENAFLVLATALLRPDKVKTIEIDAKPNQIEGWFDQHQSITAPEFVPHALRYGDLAGLMQVVRQAGIDVNFNPGDIVD